MVKVTRSRREGGGALLLFALLASSLTAVMSIVELPREHLLQMVSDQQALITELQTVNANLVADRETLLEKIRILEAQATSDITSVPSRLLRTEVSRLLRQVEKKARADAGGAELPPLSPDDANIASPKYLHIHTKEAFIEIRDLTPEERLDDQCL